MAPSCALRALAAAAPERSFFMRSVLENVAVFFQPSVRTFSSAFRIEAGLACSMPMSLCAVASSFGMNACFAFGKRLERNLRMRSPAESGSVMMMMPRRLQASPIERSVRLLRLKPSVMMQSASTAFAMATTSILPSTTSTSLIISFPFTEIFPHTAPPCIQVSEHGFNRAVDFLCNPAYGARHISF